MKKLLLATLPILWVTLLFPSCRKDNLEPGTYPAPIDYTVLPPATQTGANTFGCLVDGEVWVPRVPLLAVTYRDISALVSEKDGSGGGGITCNLVDIDKKLDDHLTLAFSSSLFQNQNYNTLSDTSLFRFNPDLRRLHVYYQHITGDTSNYFTITKIDSVRNFISGTFQCTLYTADKTQSIKITDGRFDLKYSPQ